VTFTVDNTHPTTTIGSIDISADTGSSATDFITQTASQTITGTLSQALVAGEILYGSVDGGSNWTNITAKATSTSPYLAISWNGATLSGTSTIKMKVTDAAGNDGTVAEQAYTLDTTVPTITSVTGTTVAGGGDVIVINFSETIHPASNWPAAFTSITSNGVSLDFSSTTGNFSFNGGDYVTLTLLESPTNTATYLRNGNTIVVTPKISEIHDLADNYVAITAITSSATTTGDVTAPAVALTYSPDATTYKAGDSVTITATFNEAIHEAVLPTIAIATLGDGSQVATNMSRTSNTVYTYVWTVPAGADENGTSTVSIIATDLAGNANATATNNTKQVDNTAPAITSVTGTTVQGGGDVIVINFSETIHPASNWPAAFTSITSNGISLDFSSTTGNFSFNGGNYVTLTLLESPTNTATYLRNGNTIIVTPKVSEIHDVANNYVAITATTSAAITGNDTTAPAVALTYSPNTNSYVAGAVATITATFAESLFDSVVPHIAISTQGDGDVSAVDMTKVSNTIYTYVWTVPSGVDEDGLATITISNATDLAGNTNATATNNTKTIDAVASIVDSFTVEDITSTGGTLTVQTNKISTCNYSNVDSSYASMLAMASTTNVTTHTKILTGLTPGTRYDYYVRCQDNALNTMVSSAHVSFVTSGGTGSFGIERVTNITNQTTGGVADGTYPNGWEWKIRITLPTDQNYFALKFNNWTSGSNTLTAAGNMKYYSEQIASGPGSSAELAVPFATANTFPTNLRVTTDVDPFLPGIQTDVHVMVKLPSNTVAGSYGTSYWVNYEGISEPL
jgi:CheY-specific phosphatase CheX